MANSRDLEESLKRNLEIILERVERACRRSGRTVESVRILGASKGQEIDKIKILASLGIRIFGENYVQEAEKKIVALRDLPVEWHFIGRLQTNKVKKAIRLFHVIESVDRVDLVEELEKRLIQEGKSQEVFIEVNIGEEPTKGGVKEGDLDALIGRLINSPCLEVRGLMCLPPLFEDPERVRPYFQRMQELFMKLRPLFGEKFTELSMGTSNDFEIAIEEGATIVRIGTLLFGPRT